MSDLVAIAYPDINKAEQVLEKLGQMRTAQLIDMDDAVYVTKDANGKVKLHQAVNMVRAGAGYGALWVAFGACFWERWCFSRLQARPSARALALAPGPSRAA